MGLRGSNTVPLQFEDCRLPANALLGQEGQGFKLAMVALDGGRIGIASQACGVARAALEPRRCGTRGSGRRSASRSADFQAVRFMLANMPDRARRRRADDAARRGPQAGGQPFTREASMAKVFASEMANRACDKAVQLHGGYGYIDEFPVERYLRDARVQTIYEGTSEIQRLVIARELLKAAG